jgi:hypothetical protein
MLAAGRCLLEEAVGEVEARRIEAELREVVGAAQEGEPAVDRCVRRTVCLPLRDEAEHPSRAAR